MPVFNFEFDELDGLMTRSLNGERYATDSSIFSKKIEEKLFNEKVTLEQKTQDI